MAVKVKMEKDGYRKNSYLGFSWVSLFFNMSISAYRLDFKGFLIMITVFSTNIAIGGFIEIFLKQIGYIQNTEIVSYLFMITAYIESAVIAFWYNENYTRRLIKEGWVPEDEFSYELLKKYGIINYNEEDNENLEKIEKYKEKFLELEREEKKKLNLFIVFIFIKILLIIFFIVVDKKEIIKYIFQMLAV